MRKIVATNAEEMIEREKILFKLITFSYPLTITFIFGNKEEL
jgi:hypothetical protein